MNKTGLYGSHMLLQMPRGLEKPSMDCPTPKWSLPNCWPLHSPQIDDVRYHMLRTAIALPRVQIAH